MANTPGPAADQLRLEVSGDGCEVFILANGRRPLARAGGRAYRPFHPAALLDPDLAPLRPLSPARRVAVYRCTCGHTGCGCVAPVISLEGERVTWTDFRDFTGHFEGPLAEEPADAGRGTRLPLPDLSFDAGQYLAEVERATTDRWWETSPMLTVRLLSRELHRQQDRLAALGWRKPWTSLGRDPGIFHLCLTDDQDYQICLDLPALPGPPARQARQLAESVTGTSPLDWLVTHCSLCGGWFTPSRGESQAKHDAKVARHPAHAPVRDPSR